MKNAKPKVYGAVVASVATRSTESTFVDAAIKSERLERRQVGIGQDIGVHAAGEAWCYP